MVDARQIAQARRSVVRTLSRSHDKTVGRLILRTFQTLTSATPVDTGFARSSWTPSVGTPRFSTEAEDRVSASQFRSRRAVKAGAAARLSRNRRDAEDLSRSYTSRRGGAFISTAVRYMVYLNNGSSAQAPKRFIERAIRAAVRRVGRRREIG